MGHDDMNTICLLFVVLLLALAGCATSHSGLNVMTASETVQVTYHVQPGKEAAFQSLLGQGWDVYQRDHLVFADPHVILRETEEGNKTQFVEIFTWIKSPDHPPDDVKAIWGREQSLCEARDGREGIDIEVGEMVEEK
jgi:hypothetical protein